jgi:hypothetical protein
MALSEEPQPEVDPDALRRVYERDRLGEEQLWTGNPGEHVQQALLEGRQITEQKISEWQRAIDLRPEASLLEHDLAHEERLSKRHRNHYVAPDIVYGILAAHQLKIEYGTIQKTQQRSFDINKRLREQFKNDGGFLVDYDDPPIYKQRLAPPKAGQEEYLIVSITASHPEVHQRQEVATYEFLLPPEHQQVPVVPVPDPDRADPNFLLQDPYLAKKIGKTHPARIALVPDITVQQGLSHWGFAGLGRNFGIMEIERRNRERKQHPIEVILSEVFTVHGLILPNGQCLWIGAADPSGVLKNTRGINVQLGSERFHHNAHFVWTRKEMLPVKVEGLTFLLHVQWYVFANLLSKPPSPAVLRQTFWDRFAKILTRLKERLVEKRTEDLIA